MSNPIAKLSLPGDKHWSHKFVANFSAELQLWDNLKFKTSYGADLSFGDTMVTDLFIICEAVNLLPVFRLFKKRRRNRMAAGKRADV